MLNGLLRWPLPVVLAIVAPLSLIWAWPRKQYGRVMHTYLQLAGLFATLSLLSIGGGNAVLPEMHMQAVNGHHWLTDSQFADIFSISQAAPGPSILIVTLVGYGAGLAVGGVPGGDPRRSDRHRRDDPARRVAGVPAHAVLAEGAEIATATSPSRRASRR